jgi:hypothetical protein
MGTQIKRVCFSALMTVVLLGKETVVDRRDLVEELANGRYRILIKY